MVKQIVLLGCREARKSGFVWSLGWSISSQFLVRLPVLSSESRQCVQYSERMGHACRPILFIEFRCVQTAIWINERANLEHSDVFKFSKLSLGSYKLPYYARPVSKPQRVRRSDVYCVNSLLLNVYGRCFLIVGEDVLFDNKLCRTCSTDWLRFTDRDHEYLQFYLHPLRTHRQIWNVHHELLFTIFNYADAFCK